MNKPAAQVCPGRESGESVRWEVGTPVVPAPFPRYLKSPVPAQQLRRMVGVQDRICLCFYLRALRAAPAGNAGFSAGCRGGWRIRPPSRRWLTAFSFSRRGRFHIGPQPGSRPTPGKRQRKEKLADSFSAHVHPPHRLCGSGVFRLPGSGAGSAGLPTSAGPICATPVFAKPCAFCARFGTRRFSLPPAAAHSLLSRQKRMGGGFPGNLPMSSRAAGERSRHISARPVGNGRI